MVTSAVIGPVKVAAVSGTVSVCELLAGNEVVAPSSVRVPRTVPVELRIVTTIEPKGAVAPLGRIGSNPKPLVRLRTMLPAVRTAPRTSAGNAVVVVTVEVNAGFGAVPAGQVLHSSASVRTTVVGVSDRLKALPATVTEPGS